MGTYSGAPCQCLRSGYELPRCPLSFIPRGLAMLPRYLMLGLVTRDSPELEEATESPEMGLAKSGMLLLGT